MKAPQKTEEEERRCTCQNRTRESPANPTPENAHGNRCRKYVENMHVKMFP
jgi:hypothetical protein